MHVDVEARSTLRLLGDIKKQLAMELDKVSFGEQTRKKAQVVVCVALEPFEQRQVREPRGDVFTWRCSTTDECSYALQARDCLAESSSFPIGKRDIHWHSRLSA